MRYDYSYDCMGRLTSKSASGRKLLSYTYDLNGNRSTMTDVTGKCTGYRYNSLDQLLEITDNGKVQARYDYNGDGTIRCLEVGGSLVTEYAYDVDKNLISQKTMMMGMEGGNSPLGTLQGLGNQTFSASNPLKNAVLVDNTYAYDSNANRIEKRTLAGLNRFAYDSVNRLVKAEYPTGAEEYRYDKAGNRTAKVWTGTEPGKRREESYHYDSCNRLTRQDILQEDRNQPQQIKCFYYDNQGNMLADGNRQYVYDAMNRLSEVKNTDGTHQKNHYDGEGLRAELEENGRLVSFIFDGDRVVSEKDDENTIRYIRGYELISSDSEKARTYYHYACDEMGSITHVTDEAGSILNRYEYDAFGDCTYKDETVANRFGFAGEQYDPVAGMYYLRARFYNPVIGRFIQEDTYYGDGLNLYAYCHNNPVGYVDPSGHCNEKYEAIKYLKKTENIGTQEALNRYREIQGDNSGLSAADIRKKIMGDDVSGANGKGNTRNLSKEDTLATIKSVRRYVEKVMKSDSVAQGYLKNKKYNRYGTYFHSKVFNLIEPLNIDGLLCDKPIYRPGTSGGRGNIRRPDFQWGKGTPDYTIWDLKPNGFVGSQQFNDMQLWTNVVPIALKYNRN